MIFEVLNKEMPIDDNEQDVREVFGPDMLSQVEPERGGRQVAGHRQENSEVHVGHERSSVGEAGGTRCGASNCDRFRDTGGG
jgi:hypothetical protein